MKLKDLIGPTYALKSLNYDGQRCINMYPDHDEMQVGKENEPAMLTTVPGLTLQHSLPRSPIRGIWHTANNYIYCVAGNGLFQLIPTVSNGIITWTHLLLAYLTTSTGFVSICDGVPNQYQGVLNTGLINQVVVVDGSTTGYVFQEGTTQVYQMNVGTGYTGSSFITFQDGFFLFSQPNTISAYYANDPQNISDLDVINVNLNNDFVQRIISDHDILWCMGNRSLAVFQNTGGGTTTNVFQQIPGATAPHGTNAPWSVAQIGGQLLWITNDDRGWAEVAMAFGYRALRVSNHAVELWMSTLGDISQTIAWTYQDQGHSFYCLNNVNSSTTWCYDIMHKMWHERAFFSNGQYTRDLVQFHINVFITGYGNMHLCGDYQNGNLYSLDDNNFTFNKTPIRRERRTPHSSGALKRIYYSQFQLDVQPGTGLDGTGYPIQIGTGTPTLQTATNVLMSGNGPIYTLVGNDGLPAIPTSSVMVTSTGVSSNWSNSYTTNTSNGTVSINPAILTTSTLTLGTGNGVETNFQIPNIYQSGTTTNIYLNDWRGNNLQIQAPAKNQNLCGSSINFGLLWSSSNASTIGGSWSTPDYAQTPTGTYLTEDNTYNPHFIDIPYSAVSGQQTNLSVYATSNNNSSTPITITGGVGSFITNGSFPLFYPTLTLNTVPTNGTLALGDIVYCSALPAGYQYQQVVELLTGTLGQASSTYLLYPGNLTTQSSQSITIYRYPNRYLQLLLGAQGTQGTGASAIFDLNNGTFFNNINCTPVITPVSNFPGVYRCSINYTETGNTQISLSSYCGLTGSGSQFTVAYPPAFGSITIGSTLWSGGVSTGITVLSLISGSPNQVGAVYSLSAPAGFVSGSTFQFATTISATTPSAYIATVNPLLNLSSSYLQGAPYIYSYPGTSSNVGIWGAQIGPQVSVLPLVQTSGIVAYDNVTYTPGEGLLVFEQPPFASVINTSLITVQPAASITGTFTTTTPQLNPTEYKASFNYMEGAPIYEYIGTNPQINLSYSSDGGYVYSDERSVPLGAIGSRFQRCIWRKLGMDRDRVWRITCSDPVNLSIIGAEIIAKPAETGV